MEYKGIQRITGSYYSPEENENSQIFVKAHDPFPHFGSRPSSRLHCLARHVSKISFYCQADLTNTKQIK